MGRVSWVGLAELHWLDRVGLTYISCVWLSVLGLADCIELD
jgi:hypothetical protein